jgi:glucan phosphoethanolaminetransferase (alkaline phosphatase superfamily)
MSSNNDVPKSTYDKIIDATNITTTFIATAAWSVAENNFLQMPLTSVLNVACSGTFYSIGTAFVSSCLPKYLKPVLPVLLIASAVYHIKKN